MNPVAQKTRIVILGGGFGAVATAHRLGRLFRRRPEVEVVLVSRDNFLLMTPLLFEVLSGALEPRSCSFPIRDLLPTTRFIQADVQGVDLDRRVVRLASSERTWNLDYDQLVLALGSKPNRDLIPGAEHAFAFKSLADALVLRNHVIDRLERADVESEPWRKNELLTFAIVGGGVVGAELLGELTAFVDGVAPLYRNIDRADVRFVLLHAGDRLLPEVDPALARYAARELAGRHGVEMRLNARVHAIERRHVLVDNDVIAADTIVLAAGTAPNPVTAALPLPKDARGRIVVEPTMQCPGRPGVWALGDCASVPGPDGKPYPSLAQHALREARILADNVVASLDGYPLRPFVYHTLGMMGSLGHGKGFGQFLKVRLHGFPAWVFRRAYYLMKTPGLGRRLRLLTDWVFALLFRQDVVKLALDGESMRHLGGVSVADTAHRAIRRAPVGTVLGDQR